MWRGRSDSPERVQERRRSQQVDVFRAGLQLQNQAGSQVGDPFKQLLLTLSLNSFTSCMSEQLPVRTDTLCENF